MHPRLTVARFIEAITDSGGIKATICERVPCARVTLDKWLSQHPTLKAAYEAECSRMVDVAHSIVQTNMLAARKQQQDAENGLAIVDSGDARWYLARKAADQGFAGEIQIEHSVSPITLEDWRRTRQKRLDEVEELEE